MKRILLFSIIFIFPVSLLAQSRTTFKYGTVETRMREESYDKKSRSYFSIGREYFPKNNDKLYFSYGLAYIRKAAFLGERSWKRWDSSYIGIAEIKADIAFVELPIKFGYQIPIVFDKLFFTLGSGFSLSMPVQSHSRFYHDWNRADIYDPNYPVDYYTTYEVEMNPSVNAICSAAIIYRFIGFEFQYSRALYRTEGFLGISLEDYFDSYHLLMRISF